MSAGSGGTQGRTAFPYLCPDTAPTAPCPSTIPAPSCKTDWGWAGAPHSCAAPTPTQLCVHAGAQCWCLVLRSLPGTAPCPQPLMGALWDSRGCGPHTQQGLELPQPWGEVAGQQKAGAGGAGGQKGLKLPPEGGSDESSETPGPLNALWDTLPAQLLQDSNTSNRTDLREDPQCPLLSASPLLHRIYSPFPGSFSSPALPRIHSGISSLPAAPAAPVPGLAAQTGSRLRGGLSTLRMRSVGAGAGRAGGVAGPPITAGAEPGPRDQTAQGVGRAKDPPIVGSRGSGMGSGSLLRLLCIVSVLARCLHPATAQWFSLGSEDTTPDPGTSPVPPSLDGEEGRHGGRGTWLSQHPKFLLLSMEGACGGWCVGCQGLELLVALPWPVLWHPGPPPALPPPSQRSFAPADTDASVEPAGKLLLSKPPLGRAPKRRDQPSRGAAKGSGRAPPRTRGQVGAFTRAAAPLGLLQPSRNPPAAARLCPSPYPCPACTTSCSNPNSALCAPLERSHSSSQCSSGVAEGSPGWGRVPPAPQDPPEPCRESSLSVPSSTDPRPPRRSWRGAQWRRSSCRSRCWRGPGLRGDP